MLFRFLLYFFLVLNCDDLVAYLVRPLKSDAHRHYAPFAEHEVGEVVKTISTTVQTNCTNEARRIFVYVDWRCGFIHAGLTCSATKTASPAASAFTKSRISCVHKSYAQAFSARGPYLFQTSHLNGS